MVFASMKAEGLETWSSHVMVSPGLGGHVCRHLPTIPLIRAQTGKASPVPSMADASQSSMANCCQLS